MTDLSAKFDGLRGQIASNHSLVLSRLISIDAKLDALGSIDGEIQASNTALDSIAINMQKIADTVARKPADDLPETSMFQLLANTFFAIAAIRDAIRPQGQQNPTIQPRGMEWSLALIREDMQFIQDYIGGTITGPNLQQALSNLSLNTALIGQYTQFVQEYIGGTITGPNLQQGIANLSLNTALIAQRVNDVTVAVQENTQVTLDCCNDQPVSGLCAEATNTEQNSQSLFGDIVTNQNQQIVNDANIINWQGTSIFGYQQADFDSASGKTVSAITGGSNDCMGDFDPTVPTAIRNVNTFNISLIFFAGDGTFPAVVIPPNECYQITAEVEGAFAVYAADPFEDTSTIRVEVLT